MNDVFKEQLVKKKPQPIDVIYKVCVGLAVIIIAAAAFIFINVMFPAIIVLSSFGAYYLIGFLNIEYEYCFTNGELDIDIIYNQTKRKRIFSGDVKSFDTFLAEEDAVNSSAFTNVTNSFNCSSRAIGTRKFVFVSKYKDKKYKITFEPNDMLLESINPYLGTRKVKF